MVKKIAISTIDDTLLTAYRDYHHLQLSTRATMWNRRTQHTCNTGQLVVAIAIASATAVAILCVFAMRPLNTPRYANGIAVCDSWGCRVTNGTLAGGAPFVRLRGVCVTEDRIDFLPIDASNAHLLGRELRTACVGATSTAELLCHELLLYNMRVHVSVNATLACPPSPLVRGRTFLLDTAVRPFYQFGHSLSRFVQFHSIHEKFDTIILNRVRRLPGGRGHGYDETHLSAIYNATVRDRAAGATVLSGGTDVLHCVEDLWTLPAYERPFFSAADAEAWRATVRRRGWAPAEDTSNPPCPPPRALLLARGELARRGFANAHVLHTVAAELAVAKLNVVAVGSSDSTAAQAAIFRSAGLIISGHSSQLKNLIFARPHTAVVEITGEYVPDGTASPFSEGMDELGVHYVQSRHHWPNLTACGTSCSPGRDRNAVLTLNATLLRDALLRAITLQRTACPMMRYDGS